ncbi:hypothetical protein [Aminobacter carboxidus]|uniref:Secreted protein n=1 Tax=Aminobacter carboxidus TaxID=376165 RepID=A0ABR9GUS8_9HYPH|nr:hypothetical protein [Aminobacter carboxidus]MBE1207411.1 hypothetical protein [Aminobacter carboxidus]
MIKAMRFGLFAVISLVVPNLGFAADSADCSIFEDAGSPIEVIIEDEGPRTSPPASSDPAYSVRLVYPGDYRTFPRSEGAGKAVLYQDGENFLMRLDGGPLPLSMRHTLSGKPIKPRDLPPTVRFLLHDRYSLEKLLAIRVRIVTGQVWSFEMVPITTQATAIDGLVEITNKKISTYDNKYLFFSESNGKVTDIIECRKPDPGISPQCEHSFDHRNLDVDVSYDAGLAGRWRDIKNMVLKFTSCAYAEDILEKKEGSTRWD